MSRLRVNWLFLPPEVWIKIFGSLPPLNLFTTMLRVCSFWRKLILKNRKGLPLIECHCHICVVDDGWRNDYIKDSKWEIRQLIAPDPSVQYTFTTYDTSKKDYVRKHRCCVRGNNQTLRALFVSNHLGQIRGEVEPWSKTVFRPIRVDPIVTQQFLSFLTVSSIRFDIYKISNMRNSEQCDEKFGQSLRFLQTVCGAVSLSSLCLCSQNPSSSWHLGPSSRRILQSMESIEYLEILNMEDVGFSLGQEALSFKAMKELCLKFDSSHLNSMDTLLIVMCQDSLLENMISNGRNGIDFRAFVNQPRIVLAITVEDICKCIKAWRASKKPWRCRNLSFNCLVTISEFRAFARRIGLFDEPAIIEFPYCRFRVAHREDEISLMELCCKNLRVSTNWSVRVIRRMSAQPKSNSRLRFDGYDRNYIRSF